MPRSCTICMHPERAAIEDALDDTVPLRIIADHWSVSKTALVRHNQGHLAVRPVSHPKSVSGNAMSPERPLRRTCPPRQSPLPHQCPTRYAAPATAVTQPYGGHLFPDISDHKKRAFLAAFAQLGQREAAATAVGIDSRTHRYWLHKDPVYVEAFKQAEAFVADRIEDEIFRRGVKGVERGVWHNGTRVGTERKYSDTLLIFAAKGAMPEKYRDRVDTTHEVSPAMAALIAQWEQLRDAPPPPRALDASRYDVEGEMAEPLPPLRPPSPPEAEAFAMLDAANQIGDELDDEPPEDDDAALFAAP